MRIVPLITALLVVAGLYMVVLERDRLMAFARGEETEEIAQSDVAQTGSEETATVSADIPTGVGVVAIHSRAQEIDSAVLLRGQTRAMRQVEVRAETAAIVVSDPLRKGANVERGQTLCQLDPGTREASLAEAKARLAEAKSRVPEAEARLIEARARLQEARINLNAAEKLIKGGYASETRLAAAEATERSAQAGIASAESGLETTQAGIEAAAATVAAAEREIERLTIRAPFSGLLESDTAELGSLMQPGSLCATVIELNPVKLVGFVPEVEVRKVKLGALAGAELATGQRVSGYVTFLSRSADPVTRTFETEILVPNPDLEIRDGQSATILISSDGDKAHKLPQSSLTLNNDGILGVRVVGKDSRVEFRPTKLIRDEIDGVWLAGLAEEEDVIIVGQEFVKEGVLVKPSFQEVSE